jgi:hypothetical protein
MNIMVLVYLQVVISKFIGSDTNCKADNDCRQAVAQSVIKPHWSVVDIPHFCQHTIQVQGVDHTPSEGAQPGIVKQDGRQFTRELEDITKFNYKSLDLYDCDLF